MKRKMTEKEAQQFILDNKPSIDETMMRHEFPKQNEIMLKNMVAFANHILKQRVLEERESKAKETGIKDSNGVMICFGDTVRFTDKVEWYRGEYSAKVAFGSMTREEALKEIDEKPYEERLVEDVQDYEWLLSSEIQTYWEIVKK